MYFVCIKIATFAHNLTPGCSPLVTQGSGFFVMVCCFFCVFIWIFSFFFPLSLPIFLRPFFFPFLHFCSACDQATQIQLGRPGASLSALESLPIHSALADHEGHACSLLLNQQRTFCSGFTLVCFVLNSFIF